MLLGVETQPCWLLIGAKRIVPGSPFSGAVACGDRQEGNESGCLCPRHIRPQTQPGVPECTRPPGQLRLGIKSCWPWQVGQSPEALSTPAPSAVLIPGSPSFPHNPLPGALKANAGHCKPRWGRGGSVHSVSLCHFHHSIFCCILGRRGFQCNFQVDPR